MMGFRLLIPLNTVLKLVLLDYFLVKAINVVAVFVINNVEEIIHNCGDIRIYRK